MHNKIIRRLSSVSLSLFLSFGCCFLNPIADLSAVRPLIVHAEVLVDTAGFTAIITAIMAAMGISAYYSGKNIKDISDSIVNQFDKYATTAGTMGSYAVMEGTKVVDGVVSLSKDAYNAVSSFVQNVTDLYDWKPVDNVYPSNNIAYQYYPLKHWYHESHGAYESDIIKLSTDFTSNGYFVFNKWNSNFPAGPGYINFGDLLKDGHRYTISLSNDVTGSVFIDHFWLSSFELKPGESFNHRYDTGDTVQAVFGAGAGLPLGQSMTSNYLTISDVTGLDDRVIGTGNAKLDDRVLDAAGDVSLDFGSDALSKTATLDDVIDLVNTWQLDKAWPADYPIAKDTSIPIPTAIPTTVPTAIPTAIPTTVPTAIPTAVPTVDPFPDGTTGSNYGVLGLEDVFPFCIPFDIYNILSAFCATPETPEFTWSSPYGDVTFDFHKFDDIAFWWRKALVILFLIWLLQSSRSSSLGD